MNLLIVGASSFIGKKIYQIAQEKGFNVVGTTTNPQNREWYKFNLMNDDISDVLNKSGLMRAIERKEKVYAIVAAFYCGNERTLNHMDEAVKINLIGSKRMLDIFHQLGVKALYLSTEQVFDGLKGSFYSEDDELSPVLTYGRHKAEMEKYIMKNMPEMLIYRLSQNVDVYPEGIQIFNDVYYRQMREKNFKSIKGQILSPTYIGDTAKWAIEGLKRNLIGIYHCANPEKISRAGLVRKFLAGIGSEAKVEEVAVEYFGFREGRPLDTSLDITKISKDIQGINFMSVDEIVNQFVINMRNGFNKQTLENN